MTSKEYYARFYKLQGDYINARAEMYWLLRHGGSKSQAIKAQKWYNESYAKMQAHTEQYNQEKEVSK